ncbi:hypothetical protein CSPAE12_05146 [Colletotrichum incanum]|nr:hypothetical protein CSPAE12_05146 [Colletotrichum incanum]
MERLLFPGGRSLLRCSSPAACREGFGRTAPTDRSSLILPLFVRVLGKGYWPSGHLRARFSGCSATAVS